MSAFSIKNREEALAVLDYIKSRKEKPKKPKLKLVWGDERFPEQKAFIDSKEPLNAALCTRRAGKSWAVGEKLFMNAMRFPGSTVLYCALTRDSAERIMWKDILKVLAEKKGLAYKANNTKLEMRLDNGSVIKLFGIDSDEREREKVLGGKYSYVAIDEAGSFKYDLEQLVYEYLEPAVSDYDGQIDLIGTPTMYWQGFFCKVTEGGEKGWKVFKWNTTQNPFMPNWLKRLELIKERNPRVEETPSYKRMYLGIWVKDLDSLVYKYLAERNLIDALPNKSIAGQVLGIDLGFEDATSYVLSRYYENDSNLYFIDAYKKTKQIVDKVVETIRDIIDKYNVNVIVIDNASKQVVETIRARFDMYDLTIIAAEKTDKFHFIELMNSDFISGRIKLLKGFTSPLETEYGDLIKDPTSKVPKEHPGCDNHCCDGALYSWRHARNYLELPIVQDDTSEDDRLWEKLENEHSKNTVEL